MSDRVTELHSIMPITNIPSVLQHGILSHDGCAVLPHRDVSMADVQDKRANKSVPGGLTLHQYANLYFHARNPMMSSRRGMATDLCVLRVSTEVLAIKGAVISDQNAASKYVRFLPPDMIDFLNFDMIYADDWRHPEDQIAEWRHSSMKGAEVLVPNSVETRYIVGAYVVNQDAENKLVNQGFTQPIQINSNLFFW